MTTYLAVAAGGALGAVARYTVGVWLVALAGATFPWGTLAVNATGAVLLGCVVRLAEAAIVPVELRAFLGIGFAGAFTTFSAFSYETVALLQDGAHARAAVYVVASLLLSLGGILLGFRLAEALGG